MDKKPQEQEPQRRQPTVLPQPHHPERRPTVDPIVAGSMRPEPGAENFPSDVLGSYTGIPLDGDEHPEQDADDL